MKNKGTTYEMVQSEAFSVHTLCKVTMFASYECLHFSDPKYIENCLIKSGLAQKIWDIISLPTCISHPLTTHIKELLGENRPFDLPHFKTILKKRYESIPGLRISEFNKTHKKVNVNCEMEMWLTIGQLKLLDKNTVNGLHAIVYTPVGQMEI